MKKLRITIGLIIACCCFLMGTTVCMAVPKQKANSTFIASIKMEKGDDGQEKLIGKGYKVVTPSFVDSNGDRVWMGYTTTTDSRKAITDLCIASKKTIAKKTAGKRISYKSVKGGEIRIGKSNKAYILTTTNKNAGEGLLALHFMSGESEGKDFSDVMPIANTGAITVRDAKNKPVVVNNINGKAYLTMIKEDVWNDYVGDLVQVKAISKKTAVRKLSEAGCDFYIDKAFGTKKEVVMIGYSRVSDKSEAITDFVEATSDIRMPHYKRVGNEKINGQFIYTSKSSSVGNPIIYLTYAEGMDKLTLTGRQCADSVVLTGSNDQAKQYIVYDEDYNKLADSKAKYSLRLPLSASAETSGIVVVSAKSGLSDKQDIARKELLKATAKVQAPAASNTEETKKSENIEQATEVEEVTTAVNDEPTEVEEVTEVKDEGDVGTVISDEESQNSVFEIVILVAVIILIPVATWLIKRKIEKK